MIGFKTDTKFFNERSNNRVYCKCGHAISMPSNINKMICNWCRNTVYRNEKEEFMDRIAKEMKKNKTVE